MKGGERFTALVNHRLVRADGTDAELGEPGGMLVKGPTLSTCYLHDEQATNASLVDGWYRTGDLLRADEDGFLHFVGRTKYLIGSGGENVRPAEIERVLMACPGVVEVVVRKRIDGMVPASVPPDWLSAQLGITRAFEASLPYGGAGSVGAPLLARTGLRQAVPHRARPFRRRLGNAAERPYGFHDMYPAKRACEKPITFDAQPEYFGLLAAHYAEE